MIQDKPKTRFGKCIHCVLAYYINVVHFEHKKLRTAALSWQVGTQQKSGLPYTS